MHTCSWGGISVANLEGSQVHSWGRMRGVNSEESQVYSWERSRDVGTQRDLRCIGERCKLKGISAANVGRDKRC
jgi:hypothetical protein